MSNSKRWRDLKREINRLRGQFLPRQFNPLGQYRNAARVQAHTRAFLVLSHAEIESYLEEWAKDVARASEVIWQSSTKLSMPLAYLLATLSERIGIPDTFKNNASDTPQRLADAAVKLFQKFYTQIGENHGIKEKNVLNLFGPLGVPATAWGTTLLPDLESFGALRGNHAHHSAKAVQSVLDPETEYKRVADLLASLGSFDSWLVNYKKHVR